MLIAASVILYNPDESLLRNIWAIERQVSKIYLFDNSDNIANDFITDLINKSNIKYLSKGTNVGVGEALNICAHYAIEEGYDFLLTLDQDSFPTEGMVNQMLKNFNDEELKLIGIIAPYFVNRFETEKYTDGNFAESLFQKTSGNLLNLQIFQNAGDFRADFFIDYVDIEYGFRLNKLGYKVMKIDDARLIHNEGNLERRKLFGRTFYFFNHAPVRWYYKIRNLFYLRDEFKNDYPEFFKRAYKNNIKQFIKILFYEDNKIKKIKYAFRGYQAYQRLEKGIIK
ncbi:MAG: glycosyltransferase [Ignavibacteriales bacterium]|nr:glycosyltransferase [Ignavibacteriales bacterium]